jgi:hypothetical protein
MNGTGYHYVKQIKPDSEGHMAYFLSYSKSRFKKYIKVEGRTFWKRQRSRRRREEG